jgi:hypothetical protein
MSKAQRYYARAAHCKTRAEKAIDPVLKRLFEQLAKKRTNSTNRRKRTVWVFKSPFVRERNA